LVDSVRRTACRTLAFSLACAACSGPRIEYVGLERGTERQSERMPLEVGNFWTFAVSDEDGDPPIQKTQRVLRRELVGLGPNAATEAFFLVTSKVEDASLDKTESWQGLELDASGNAVQVVRYREVSYDKKTGQAELDQYWDRHRLRVDDFHAAAMGTWTETYTESKLPADDEPELDVPQTETWSVASDDEVVEVPAGTFHAVVVVRHADDPADEKRYFFAKGVGKIKETGGKTEVLLDCSVGGKSCAELRD
jgi:hypothetical protein